eukprot:366203-Chlamydomonas_euryale.AAC.7
MPVVLPSAPPPTHTSSLMYAMWPASSAASGGLSAATAASYVRRSAAASAALPAALATWLGTSRPCAASHAVYAASVAPPSASGTASWREKSERTRSSCFASPAPCSASFCSYPRYSVHSRPPSDTCSPAAVSADSHTLRMRFAPSAVPAATSASCDIRCLARSGVGGRIHTLFCRC